MNKFKHTLINLKLSDSSEWVDFILSDAIQNTLRPYWDWAEQNQIDILFMKELDQEPNMYNIRIRVIAEFNNSNDAAIFKLAYGDKVHTKLEISSKDMSAEII